MSQIQRRTATVDIYQGDVLDRLRYLEKRYDQAIADEKFQPALNEKPESQVIREEHKALKAEAEESRIVVTLTALGRKQWRELVAAHPPREGNKGDELMGANDDTFGDALVPLSIVGPEWLRDDLDSLADVDFQRLYAAAFALNRAPATDPKVLASPKNQQSGETSN